MSALSLLGRLDELDKLHGGQGRELLVGNITGSMNYDGAFGAEPGAESHGAQGESAGSPSAIIYAAPSFVVLGWSWTRFP